MSREPLSDAARRRAERERRWREEGEPSFARRLGQIGVLGWIVIVPTLGGAFLGRWIDHAWDTGIFFTAPLLLLGLALGCHFGWRWVNRDGDDQ